jgi:hypothetical protein
MQRAASPSSPARTHTSGPRCCAAAVEEETPVLWLLPFIAAFAGLHFAEELSAGVAMTPTQIRLLIGGALVGLGLSFVISAFDAWLADARRRF